MIRSALRALSSLAALLLGWCAKVWSGREFDETRRRLLVGATALATGVVLGTAAAADEQPWQFTYDSSTTTFSDPGDFRLNFLIVAEDGETVETRRLEPKETPTVGRGGRS